MKRIILRVFVFVCIFSLAMPQLTKAFSINPVAMMNAIFGDLGVDKPELQNAVKIFNVSRTKKEAPTVSVSFDPAHPIAGNLITAIAQPANFLNDSSQLYYTWYLKHADDSLSHPDYEKWKTEAMRIIARGGFEPTASTYNSRGADDSDSKSGYKALFGGEGEFSLANDAMQKCFLHNFITGDEYPIICRHLFPKSGPDNIGNGRFTMAEEKYWQTDPNEQDTLGAGHSDEANVAGLGAFQFSWIYQPGDEVMVAVEGSSIEPTQDKDASYKVMWALPKNKCGLVLKPGDSSGSTSTTSTTSIDPTTLVKTVTIVERTPSGTVDPINFTTTQGSSSTNTVDIYDPICYAQDSVSGNCTGANYPDLPTSETISTSDNNGNSQSTIDKSLEDCPEFDENLIDPLAEGSSQRLDVSLSYGPQNPINNIADPDRLMVTSTVLGADDASGLNYTWHVSEANSANDVSSGNWKTLSRGDIPELANANGTGLSDLKFNLALPGKENSKFYLKIKIDVDKKLSSDSSQTGTAYVIIPVVSTNKKINVYSTNITADGKVQNQAVDQRCATGMDGVLCPVVKNEIVGVEVPDLSNYENYSWAMNGEKIDQASYGDYPYGKILAYFPVLGGLGDQFTITFSATNQDNGQVITLSKTFEVVDPKVSIVCTTASSNCYPDLLGYYKNLDGTTDADFSTENFETTQGTTALLAVDRNMPFDKNFQWYVDGNLITSDASANALGASVNQDTRVLSLPINKNLDETYNISYTSDYYQDNNIMKILNQYHGVQLNEFYEKKLGDTINLKVGYVSTVSSGLINHKSLASLITNTSSYLNFLFRIVLTIGLFLFVTKTIVALLPNSSRE